MNIVTSFFRFFTGPAVETFNILDTENAFKCVEQVEGEASAIEYTRSRNEIAGGPRYMCRRVGQ